MLREDEFQQILINNQNEVLKKLIRLDTQMGSLVGNGQPGRIDKIEKLLLHHDRKISIAQGKAMVWGIIGGAVISLIAGIGAKLIFFMHVAK